MAWYDKLRDFSDVMVQIDEKLGIKRLLQYISVCLFLVVIFNFKTIVKDCIEIVNELNEEIHTEKMEKRDQLLHELLPMLQEFRAEVGADRILYLEYHNSKENLVGIPFKYVDLVLQNSCYSIPLAPESNFRDINVGMITNLYEDVKLGQVVYCSGDSDTLFINKYQGNHEMFRDGDGSAQQVFISIPGVKQPVGLIVLEWMHEDESVNLKRVKEVAYTKDSFVSRINGLIMSKI